MCEAPQKCSVQKRSAHSEAVAADGAAGGRVEDADRVALGRLAAGASVRAQGAGVDARRPQLEPGVWVSADEGQRYVFVAVFDFAVVRERPREAVGVRRAVTDP